MPTEDNHLHFATGGIMSRQETPYNLQSRSHDFGEAANEGASH